MMMLQMYWGRVEADLHCIESIFCRWLQQWPYKAGVRQRLSYPVRTLSVVAVPTTVEKKEEEDSIELPIVNSSSHVVLWNFGRKIVAMAAVGIIQLGASLFSGEFAHKLHFAIFPSLWDICCTLRIYCTDLEATIFRVFPAWDCRFARSVKNWGG